MSVNQIATTVKEVNNVPNSTSTAATSVTDVADTTPLSTKEQPMTEQTVIPTGYMQNAQGHLIPSDKVKPIDKLRDETVRRLIVKAKELQSQMMSAKDILFDEFDDFTELSASDYDTKLGGNKGNTTLLSYDGKYKIQRAVSDSLVFDERLQVAKSLIDECLNEWTQGSNDNIKAIINNAFDVDKEGKINTQRVLSLRRLDITDKKWLQAMTAISDATQVVSSKEYIRFYERDDKGVYQQISLDFAKV